MQGVLLMTEQKIGNAIRSLFWGVFAKIATFVFPFIVKSVIIQIFSVEYNGLESLFSSIFQILNFSELGIGSALLFVMYRPIAEHNIEKVNYILAFYKRCYRWIGSVILIAGLLLMPALTHLVKGDVPYGINIYILYVLNLGNTVSSYFLFAYKKSILYADQRTDVLNIIDFVLTIIQHVTRIIILLVFKNYYLYFAVAPVITLLNNIYTSYIAKKMYPEYFPYGNMPKEDLKIIKSKVIGLFAKNIGNVVMNSVDGIIISSFLGLVILGKYNYYYYIASSLVGLLGAVSITFRSIVGNCIVTKSKNDNYLMFNRIKLVYFWIICWSTICLLILYQPFIELWVGKSNQLSIVVAILMSAYFFCWKIGEVIGVYQEGAGLWWEGKFVPLCSSLINLLSNIILVQYLGIVGVILSTIIAYIFINIPFGGYIVFKYYFADLQKLKKYIFDIVKCFIITTGIGGLSLSIFSNIEFQTVYISFLFRTLYCVIVPNAVLFFLNRRKDEFLWIRDILSAKLCTNSIRNMKGK